MLDHLLNFGKDTLILELNASQDVMDFLVEMAEMAFLVRQVFPAFMVTKDLKVVQGSLVHRGRKEEEVSSEGQVHQELQEGEELKVPTEMMDVMDQMAKRVRRVSPLSVHPHDPHLGDCLLPKAGRGKSVSLVWMGVVDNRDFQDNLVLMALMETQDTRENQGLVG